MPYPPKFQEYPDLERVDFEPTTLIVGTFNPSWSPDNTASWFNVRTHDEYGKRNKKLGDVLPRLYEKERLINAGPTENRSFCCSEQIAFTDPICSMDEVRHSGRSHTIV